MAVKSGVRLTTQPRMTAWFCSNLKKEDPQPSTELASKEKSEISKRYSYYPESMVALINSEKFIAKILK